MPQTLKILGQTAILAAGSTVYTVPTATTAIIKEIIFCNTSTDSAKVSVNFIKSGDTSGVKNSILKDSVLISNETQVFSMSSFLDAGTVVKVSADTDQVVGVTISGVEMS
jgi:hypothetical protein